MLVGSMIFTNPQIIDNLTGFAFLGQCGKPQGSRTRTPFVIHITGLRSIKFFRQKIIDRIKIALFYGGKPLQLLLKTINGRPQIGFPETSSQATFIQCGSIDLI